MVARAVGRKIKGNIDVALLVPSDLPAQLGSQESPSRGWQALGLVTPKHGGGYTSPEESQIDPGLRDLKLGQLPGSSGAVAKTRLLHFDSAAPAQGAIYAQVMLVKIWGSVGRRFAASSFRISALEHTNPVFLRLRSRLLLSRRPLRRLKPRSACSPPELGITQVQPNSNRFSLGCVLGSIELFENLD